MPLFLLFFIQIIIEIIIAKFLRRLTYKHDWHTLYGNLLSEMYLKAILMILSANFLEICLISVLTQVLMCAKLISIEGDKITLSKFLKSINLSRKMFLRVKP